MYFRIKDNIGVNFLKKIPEFNKIIVSAICCQTERGQFILAQFNDGSEFYTTSFSASLNGLIIHKIKFLNIKPIHNDTDEIDCRDIFSNEIIQEMDALDRMNATDWDCHAMDAIDELNNMIVGPNGSAIDTYTIAVQRNSDGTFSIVDNGEPL